jgi:hypothetical protein
MPEQPQLAVIEHVAAQTCNMCREGCATARSGQTGSPPLGSSVSHLQESRASARSVAKLRDNCDAPRRSVSSLHAVGGGSSTAEGHTASP